MKIKKIIKKKPVIRINKDGSKRIKVSSSKAKGRNLQKLIAKKISELLNEPYGPDEDIASRPMGQSGCDIRLSPRVRKLFPYSVECKCNERFNVVSAIQQAVDNQQEGTEWLLFFTKNRFPTTVIMDCNHFFEILQRLQNAQKTSNKKLSNS